MVKAVAGYLEDDTAGLKVLAEIDSRRDIRSARLQKFRPRGADEDAIMYEAEAALADPGELVLANREVVIP